MAKCLGVTNVDTFFKAMVNILYSQTIEFYGLMVVAGSTKNWQIDHRGKFFHKNIAVNIMEANG